MEDIKEFIYRNVEAANFNYKSIKQFEEILMRKTLSNKNKQVLQGYVIDCSLLEKKERESAKWFYKIYAMLENSDNSPPLNEVYFSPGEDCRNAIVEYLRKAIKSVQVCVFTISDDSIANEIISCKRKGISVKVITDDDKSMDKGSDIQAMADAGVPVKMDISPNHMHHKFAIIDNEILITGSYNWTRSAYTRNQENILVTNAFDVIDKYQSEFDRLWRAF